MEREELRKDIKKLLIIQKEINRVIDRHIPEEERKGHLRLGYVGTTDLLIMELQRMLREQK